MKFSSCYGFKGNLKNNHAEMMQRHCLNLHKAWSSSSELLNLISVSTNSCANEDILKVCVHLFAPQTWGCREYPIMNVCSSVLSIHSSGRAFSSRWLH